MSFRSPASFLADVTDFRLRVLVPFRFFLSFATHFDRRCLAIVSPPAAVREMIAPVAGANGVLEDLNEPPCLLIVDQTWTILDQIRYAFWTVARIPKVAVVFFAPKLWRSKRARKCGRLAGVFMIDACRTRTCSSNSACANIMCKNATASGTTISASGKVIASRLADIATRPPRLTDASAAAPLRARS